MASMSDENISDTKMSNDSTHALEQSCSNLEFLTTPTKKTKIKKVQSLDRFRKRQLDIEEGKLEELKKIRKCIEESNELQKQKIDILKQIVSTKTCSQ